MQEIRVCTDKNYFKRIKEVDSIKSDIFYNNYLEASRMVYEIISSQEGFGGDRAHERSDNHRNDRQYEDYPESHDLYPRPRYNDGTGSTEWGNYEEINNIICFSGRNGSGKTSSMLTFSELLVDSRESKYGHKNVSDEPLMKKLKDYSFVDTNLIDPNLFKADKDLLRIVITSMFEVFKRAYRIRYKNEDKSKLLDLFDKVYDSLKLINDDKELRANANAIEALSLMSDSLMLKRNIEALTKQFLKFMMPDLDVKKRYLLVKIDVADINSEYSMEIIEQCRKYLMLPNVIVLIACDLLQVQELVIQKDKSHLPTEKINEQYLNKLFPEARRTYMPELDTIMSAKLVVRHTVEERMVEEGYLSVEAGLRDIIYSRTGFYFPNRFSSVNSVVPHNLRGIVNLVTWLYTLEPCNLTASAIYRRIMENEPYNPIFNELTIWLKTTELIENGQGQIQYRNINKSEAMSYKDMIAMVKKNLEDNMLKDEKSNLMQYGDSHNLECNPNSDLSDTIKQFINKLETETISTKFKPLFLEWKSMNSRYYNQNLYLVTKKNLQKFSNYYMCNWLNTHLMSKDYDSIEVWCNIEPFRKNHFIYTTLQRRFNIGNDFLSHRHKQYKKYYEESIAKSVSNYSLNCVLDLIKHCEGYITSDLDLNYLNALRMLYSLTIFSEYLTIRYSRNPVEIKKASENYMSMVRRSSPYETSEFIPLTSEGVFQFYNYVKTLYDFNIKYEEVKKVQGDGMKVLAEMVEYVEQSDAIWKLEILAYNTVGSTVEYPCDSEDKIHKNFIVFDCQVETNEEAFINPRRNQVIEYNPLGYLTGLVNHADSLKRFKFRFDQEKGFIDLAEIISTSVQLMKEQVPDINVDQLCLRPLYECARWSDKTYYIANIEIYERLRRRLKSEVYNLTFEVNEVFKKQSVNVSSIYGCIGDMIQQKLVKHMNACTNSSGVEKIVLCEKRYLGLIGMGGEVDKSMELSKIPSNFDPVKKWFKDLNKPSVK